MSSSSCEQPRNSQTFKKIIEAAPFSGTVEALRHIKVAIDLYPKGAKVIGIVSALPGEGKTTVATSFAAFIAKNGARTLLIDADLRNPSMTRTLGYTNAPGLLNMVAERCNYKELINFRFEIEVGLLASLSPDARRPTALTYSRRQP